MCQQCYKHFFQNCYQEDVKKQKKLLDTVQKELAFCLQTPTLADASEEPRPKKAKAMERIREIATNQDTSVNESYSVATEPVTPGYVAADAGDKLRDINSAMANMMRVVGDREWKPIGFRMVSTTFAK